jgi:hypothetical protein
MVAKFPKQYQPFLSPLEKSQMFGPSTPATIKKNQAPLLPAQFSNYAWLYESTANN